MTGIAGGGGGVEDHGQLTGLADNDHPQYQTYQHLRGPENADSGTATPTQYGGPILNFDCKNLSAGTLYSENWVDSDGGSATTELFDATNGAAILEVSTTATSSTALTDSTPVFPADGEIRMEWRTGGGTASGMNRMRHLMVTLGVA